MERKELVEVVTDALEAVWSQAWSGETLRAVHLGRWPSSSGGWAVECAVCGVSCAGSSGRPALEAFVEAHERCCLPEGVDLVEELEELHDYRARARGHAAAEADRMLGQVVLFGGEVCHG